MGEEKSYLPTFLLGNMQYTKSPRSKSSASKDNLSAPDDFDTYPLKRTPTSSPLNFRQKTQDRREPRLFPPSTSLLDMTVGGISNPTISVEKHPDDVEDEKWTTVFGFPPEEIDRVVEFVRRLGSPDQIVTGSSGEKGTGSKDVPAGPTWIHVGWKTMFDAQKALGKQGTLMAGKSHSYMLGVIPYRKAKDNLIRTNLPTWWTSPIKDSGKPSVFLKPERTKPDSTETSKTSVLDRLLETILG